MHSVRLYYTCVGCIWRGAHVAEELGGSGGGGSGHEYDEVEVIHKLQGGMHGRGKENPVSEVRKRRKRGLRRKKMIK